MPGPGNNKKANLKVKPSSQIQPQTQVVSSVSKTFPASLCLTLEEDEMTRCSQPATHGHPRPERCKIHQSQYVTMYKKYKDAAKIVDDMKQGGKIPTKDQIERSIDHSAILEKSRLIKKYIEAIRVERTGREIHGNRFFLKSEWSRTSAGRRNY
jgi:hypothetical protein